jgi:hypothetical protein
MAVLDVGPEVVPLTFKFRRAESTLNRPMPIMLDSVYAASLVAEPGLDRLAIAAAAVAAFVTGLVMA